jgi:hypothetical protein
MNPIKSIYIPHVEQGITAEYIMNAFEANEIATVSKITLVPNYSPSKYSGEIYVQAFIDIHSWHETESAYEFIQTLKYSSEETRFVHSGDSWWVVEVNPKPWITTMNLFEDYTVVNWMLSINAQELVSMLEATFQRATNELGAKLLQRLSDESEWLSIERSLFEEKAYQQLEDDLCL